MTVDVTDAATAWSVAEIAVANAATYGVRKVSVAGRTWTHSWPLLAGWSNGATNGATSTRVVVSLS